MSITVFLNETFTNTAAVTCERIVYRQEVRWKRCKHIEAKGFVI